MSASVRAGAACLLSAWLALGTAPAAIAEPPGPGTGPGDTVGTAPHGPGQQELTVSRVDVYDHPQIGAVVTVDRTVTRAQAEAGLTVTAAGTTVVPTVHGLSAQDLELVIVPDPAVPDHVLAGERRSLTRLVQDLPARARVGVLGPVPGGRPSTRGPRDGRRAAAPSPAPGPPELSTDPAEAVRALSGLTRTTPGATPAERLEAALAAFSPGAATRRTLVLVTADARAEAASTLTHLRRRLLASGTQLFVVDLAAGRSSDVAMLAEETGGFATRLPADRAADAVAATAARVVDALDHQYYIMFTDPRVLPHPVTVRLRAGGREWRRDVMLPQHNPQPPDPWVLDVLPPPAGAGRRADLPLVLLAAALVASSIAYSAVMLVASRRQPAAARRVAARVAARAGEPPRLQPDLFYVFLLPCLNEERVIRATVERLLSIPADNTAIMVIDDDSDDGTADIVSGLLSDRVWLLRRHAPDARQGKGEALNDGVRELCLGERLAGHDPDRVIVVVVDADGRLDRFALTEVAPLLADPAVGAVQTGVRINNRRVNLLARMQDMEFFIYTQVFQRGRRHLGSVGMGGNGQFVRLSALLCLGPAPWSRSLTEDLDLGVRLLTHGWRNEFCSTAVVHQQGLVDLRLLVRQRTRWFQGHLQSWRLVPTILRGAPPRARGDLVYHLSSPFLLLIASLLTASFVVSLVDSAVTALHGRNPLSWWTLTTYLLAFGPSIAFTYLYWREERRNRLGLVKAWGFAHVYVLYGLMWYLAGWRAVWRTLHGRTGWAKTARTPEPVTVIDVTDAAVGAPAAPGGPGEVTGEVTGGAGA